MSDNPSAMHQPVFDRRTNQPYNCKHESAIGELKANNNSVLDELRDINDTMKDISKVIGTIPVLEHRIVTLLETMATTTGRVETLETDLNAVDKRTDRFKTQIVTIYGVFVFMLPTLGWGFVRAFDAITADREKLQITLQRHSDDIKDLRDARLMSLMGPPQKRYKDAP
jgi:hypothetical protein